MRFPKHGQQKQEMHIEFWWGDIQKRSLRRLNRIL